MPNPNLTSSLAGDKYTAVEYFSSGAADAAQTSYPRTIQELTGGLYSEIIYNSVSAVTGSFMGTITDVLNKCDLNTGISGAEYSLQFQQAVMEFQSKMGMQATGILNNATWQTMLAYVIKYSDIIGDSSAAGGSNDEYSTSESPHHNSFFDADNVKSHRRNGKDIKIVFGNNSITKTLKNVYMRSVSVEVDTSGNPISEVYEFIAQDIKESDEPTDANKYTVPESNIDVNIKYSFGRILN